MVIEPTDGYDFFQNFGEENWRDNWIFTTKKNYSGKWTVRETAPPQGYEGEKMLFMKDGPNYFGVSHPFSEPIEFKGQTFVVQYEVRHQEKNECAGGYLKLFSNENYVPSELSNETHYSIMFGADHCSTTNKVHFIIRYKDRKTGVVTEKHMKNPPQTTLDKINHLYTLIIRPNNSFAIYIDGSIQRQGNLDADMFEGGFNPPKVIPDPNETKPADWDSNQKIPDPNDKKPDDWNESEPEFIPDPEKLEPPEGWLVNESLEIPDPNATKPDEWDDDVMGQWEPPVVPNPKCSKPVLGCGPYSPPLIKNEKYRGKWKPHMIDNPQYKGEWKPKDIPNPNYYEETNVYENILPIYGIGFENWVVDKMVGFTNIWVGHNESAVLEWNKNHFQPKHLQQDIGQDTDDRKRPGSIHSISPFQTFTDYIKNFGHYYQNAYEARPILVIIATIVVILIPLILFCGPLFKFMYDRLLRKTVNKYSILIRRKLFGKKKKESNQKKSKNKKF